jgi:hypothetical protein
MGPSRKRTQSVHRASGQKEGTAITRKLPNYPNRSMRIELSVRTFKENIVYSREEGQPRMERFG